MTDLHDNPMGLNGFEFVEFASPQPVWWLVCAGWVKNSPHACAPSCPSRRNRRC